MQHVSRIGMDTSKHIFQLHGVNAAERPVLRKKLRRKDMVTFFERLAPTVIAIEACGASHHWAPVVTLPLDKREASRLRNCHAAATAVRHVSIAAERSARCVWADVRWRWTLKVLSTAACVERNFWAEPGLLNRCILRSRRRVG